MSDATSKLDIGDAFMHVIALATKMAISEKEVGQDPEILGPARVRQQESFDMVEEFLQFHLYGGCGRCA